MRAAETHTADPRWLVGAYTPDMNGTSEGIVMLGSTPDGSLEPLGLAVAAPSPSYLAVDGDTVYAALEGEGAVASFRLADGGLIPIARASTSGSAPCHLGVMNGTVLAAFYGDGTLGVIDAESLQLVQTLSGEGSGPHPAQDGPHAHSSFRLDERTVLSADLGSDQLHVHRFADGRLSRESSFSMPAGTGPRDIRRHSSGRLLVLGELSLEVFLLEWDGAALRIIDSIALPGGTPGDHAAEVSLSTDERFAYVGLRGSNQLSILGVATDGSLSAVGAVSCGGDWPRHHAVDGDLLHVANQLSNTVASFRIPENGIPQPIGEPISVASPTHLLRVF